MLTFNDLARISKDNLINMCERFKLSEIGSASDLAQRLWDYYSNGNEKDFSEFSDMLYTPKGSISWFSVAEGSLENLISNINNLPKNPFSEIIPIASNLSTVPFLYAASEDDKGYYLKFAFEKGNIFINEIDGRRSVSKIEFGIVFIDLDLTIVEIRSPYNNTTMIARKISELSGEDVALERINILEKHNNKLEDLATSLDGNLIEVIEVPSLENKELDISADIYQILSSIDDSIETNDYDELETKLKEMGELIDKDFPGSTFTLLLLAGLSQIRLGTVQLANTSAADIRDTPLYSILKPYLKNTRGFVELRENIDGVIEYYKIQVGVITNTISLDGNFNEELLENIRQNIS